MMYSMSRSTWIKLVVTSVGESGDHGIPSILPLPAGDPAEELEYDICQVSTQPDDIPTTGSSSATTAGQTVNVIYMLKMFL